MLNVVIIDDELPALDELSFLITKVGNIQILGAYNDPIEGLKNVKMLKPDIAFIDVEMPQMSGISVAQEITRLGLNIEIIFVTAYGKYAVKAFELNAIDYILKPISFERLEKCIDKVKKTINSYGEAGAHRQVLNYKLDKFSNLNKLAIWDKDGLILLNPLDILYITTEQKYTVIVLRDRKYKSKDSLDTYEKKLINHNFFRCHRAFIVNMEKVERISTWIGSTYIIHINGTKESIPVSKRNAKIIKEIVSQF